MMGVVLELSLNKRFNIQYINIIITYLALLVECLGETDLLPLASTTSLGDLKHKNANLSESQVMSHLVSVL